ncbi:hypothetical protein ACFXPX_38570 [Kitasatospora sp. NPDC059146]|uniref:hypothetical protein n=1 Tax=unclassified Kitasatospora TaxID=2633591 RepID=UPI00367F8B8B
MTHATRPILTEAAVQAILTDAGWILATDEHGKVCDVDDLAHAGDFSTQAQDPTPDGNCAKVLLLCRTPDCVPVLTEMNAHLLQAGFGSRPSDDGMEFLLILPRPDGGRRR